MLMMIVNRHGILCDIDDVCRFSPPTTLLIDSPHLKSTVRRARKI